MRSVLGGPALLLAALAAGCSGGQASSGSCGGAGSVAEGGPVDYPILFWQGRPIEEFVAVDTARQAQWRGNLARPIPPALVARARRVPGRWHVLVVAENWCGDAVNTVPYIAHLAGELPGSLDVRIVHRKECGGLLHGHETYGREAVPLVLLLDEDYEERGAWVERPRPLAEWMEARRDSLTDAQLTDYKLGWYSRDRGVTTLAEFVALLERAAAAPPPARAGG